LPPGWKGMKMLVERAIKIKRELEKDGIEVIETHPSSALKNANYNLSSLINLKNINLNDLSKDVVDAIVCSAVAWAYVR